MATLKISDLSVGDWVKCAQRNGRIQRIAMHDGETVEVIIGTDLGWLYMYKRVDEIDPIPITAEILEKNGWECVEVGDNGPSTPKQYYNRYERWRLETKWGKRELFFDRMTKIYRLKGMNDYGFAEVHKLQHALRLSDFYNYDISL